MPIGRIEGQGDGADLLLYAPLDTAFSTDPDRRMSVDRRSVAGRDDDARAISRDGDVVGMGAENPKGYAACVIAAAQAIKAAAVPLKGSLLVGLGAGGMPTNRRPSSEKFNAGQGARLRFHAGTGRARMISRSSPNRG